MLMSELEFDPDQVGDLEVGWWRAHNNKDKPLMAKLLTEWLVALYSFNLEEAQSAIESLAEGVKYHDTQEWKKAIRAVTEYYRKIKQNTKLIFDPEEVARLEVRWWRLHDRLETNPDKSRLAEAFALLYATHFGTDAGRLKRAGELKAQATYQHDLAEDPTASPVEIEGHWEKARQLLVDFYTELKQALASQRRGGGPS